MRAFFYFVLLFFYYFTHLLWVKLIHVIDISPNIFRMRPDKRYCNIRQSILPFWMVAGVLDHCHLAVPEYLCVGIILQPHFESLYC